jgi:hypothetical protein
MRLLPFFLLFVLGTAQQIPLLYTTTDDTYVSSNQPNTNYGSEDYLKVSRLWGENRALFKFNLDGTKQLFDIVNNPVMGTYYIDCNHWYNVLSINLNVNLTQVESCPWGCDLYLYTSVGNFSQDLVTWNCPNDLNLNNFLPDCYSEWHGGAYTRDDLIGVVTVYEGQSGLLSFDITSIKDTLVKPFLNISFVITMEHSVGTVLIASSESGSPAYVSVENPHQPVHPVCDRKYEMVFGINVSYLVCEPEFEIPDQNPLLWNFGMPEYSYLYGPMGQLVANGLNRKVYLYDWVGTGYSEKVLDLNVFNYSFVSQELYLEQFVKQMNLTANGKKIHHYSYEVGNNAGIYFEYLNQDQIASIIFGGEGYITTCPEVFDNTNSGNGYPPPEGVGICQRASLLPRQLPGEPLNSEWDLWENCVYASYNCTCQELGPEFFDPEYQYSLFSPYAPPPFQVLEYNCAPYENSTQDPYCETNRVMKFPQFVPVLGLPGSPAESNEIYTTINSFMRETEIPKLVYMVDNNVFLGVETVEVAYANKILKNVRTPCIITASSHLGHYDGWFNFAQEIIKFVNDVEAGLV